MADLILRRAAPQDRDDVLLWRNDTAARAASLSPKAVEAGEHARWFAAAIRDGGCFFLIAEHDGAKVGSIRFDRIDEEAWRANIFLNPDHFGQGLGERVLAAGLKRLFEETDAARVAADVKTTNAASMAIFKKCGFEALGETYGVTRFVLRRSSP